MTAAADRMLTADRLRLAGAPPEVVEAVRALGLHEGVLDPSVGRWVVGARLVGDRWEFVIADLPGTVWRSEVWGWTP